MVVVEEVGLVCKVDDCSGEMSAHKVMDGW